MYRRVAHALRETVKQINLQSQISNTTFNDASVIYFNQASSDSDVATLFEGFSDYENFRITSSTENLNHVIYL